jgi:predicted RNA-binding Zn ribbon-like protein
MNDRDKRRVGEQIEPGGRPKAPGRLETLQRFVNTWNHDFPAGWDRLGTPSKARAWLLQKRLVTLPVRITGAEAARLRDLREAIRALIAVNHGSDLEPGALATLRREAARTRLRVGFGAGGVVGLEPVVRGTDGAIAALLGILYEAQLTGAWPRVKTCRQCGYFFFDRSKNRSAAWCAMSICGNRTKNRTYRRRRARVASP